ncbi:hypothetical protein [Mycobacterium sp.]|uniref:hypothetical protein n=1 Tax=Mycobacterium sp. TaxID=1785 RepID=UPI003C7725C4
MGVWLVTEEVGLVVHPLGERCRRPAQDRLDVTGDDRRLLRGGRLQRDVGIGERR